MIARFVAIAENGVIGRDNGLPWRLSTDLKRFKARHDGQAHHHGPQDLGELSGRPLPGPAEHRGHAAIPAFRAEGAESGHARCRMR